MRNYEQYFEGHDVPRKIKEITINIMRRFTIYGLCDGMYISNVIAYETGLGDGESHFTNGEGCWNMHKIAQKLDIGYFVCANTGAKDGANTDGWYNLGYIEDRTVNVDWESESWQELLERDMFEALKEYVEKNNLHFDMPNPELPFPEVVSETNQNYIKKEDSHKYVFTITYNFDPDSVAKLCKTHEEAVRRLREYLEAEINTIKTEQDYDPSILEWSEDDVVFVYAAGYEKGDDRNYALEDCAYYRIFEL